MLANCSVLVLFFIGYLMIDGLIRRVSKDDPIGHAMWFFYFCGKLVTYLFRHNIVTSGNRKACSQN